MTKPEHYASDVLFFFDGRPTELALYEALLLRMEAAFPDASVKVQKSQISFYHRHLFAAASLPLRRRKGWPKQALLVTLGLPYRLDPPGWPWRWSPTPAAGPTMCWCPSRGRSTASCWAGCGRPMTSHWQNKKRRPPAVRGSRPFCSAFYFISPAPVCQAWPTFSPMA